MNFLNHPLAAPGAAVLVGLASLTMAALMPTATMLVWMEEDGPIERCTLVLYFLAALGVCGDRERLRAPVWMALVTLLLAALARELDWHKSFTGVSILKVSYYIGPGPAAYKVLALLMVSATVLAGVYLSWRFAGPLWRGVRSGYAPACTVLTVLIVLIFSKLVDRSLGVLAEDYGVQSSGQARALQLSLEESLELALPGLVLLGLLQGRKLGRRRHRGDTAPAVPGAAAPH